MTRAFLASVLSVLVASSTLFAQKLIYEPISAEAGNLGRLEKYERLAAREAEVELGDMALRVRVPERANAYDAVPISYRLTGQPGANDRVAVQATAFEDESRRTDRDLYDLALPGNMNIKVELLGTRTGIFEPDRVTRLTQTSRHETFPPYRLEPFVQSGTVEQGSYLFFKFRVTNIGDTILDAEGFGGWMAVPQVWRVGTDGKEEMVGHTINQYERHLDYLYPGESYEHWVSFMQKAPGIPPHKWRTLPQGDLVLRYYCCYRWHREYDWAANMWVGRPWTRFDFPITVAEQAAQTPIEVREVEGLEAHSDDRMTQYVGSFEEFMTSFKVFEKDQFDSIQSGTMNIQVAPWTKQIVVKLLGNHPGQIKTVAVPIDVATGHLGIEYNADNPFVVRNKGQKVPAFCAQSMVAMRATTQLGPQPEKHIPQRLEEKLDAGVNLVCTTSGDWAQPEIYNPEAFVGDVHAETWKYYFDVVVPNADVPTHGWGIFPCKTTHILGVGEVYWGRNFDVPFVELAHTYTGAPELDVAHPDFPKLYAGAILFNYERWGHLWYTTAEGDLIIDVEDSWGWHRDDINLRYMLGAHAIHRFHEWLDDKYGDIDALNKAWETDFKQFIDIDPQKDQGNEGKPFGHDMTRIGPVYNKPDHVFHDWNRPMIDWDTFRTELRCDIYEDILEHVRKVIPNAYINIRTEGAIIPVEVDPDSDIAHIRHVHYSQRRQALIAEVLQRRKVFKYHSDYTTIPYTESEWRMLLTKLREQGMRGNYMPQFCTARDMVVNDHWGRDYQLNYNLDEPKKAIRVHRLQAAYPVWKIMYEEGHLPGVLWEDYLCDGFMTETQKAELRLLRQNLNALGRPE